jgi:allantoinase
MPRTVLTTPAGVSVIPDVPNWSWHEYGMRVGFWQLKAALDQHNVNATMAVNASGCLSYPRLAKAALLAGWEFMGHGCTQKALHVEEDQREVIRKSIETIRGFTGKPPRGWLGPGLTET